MKKFLLLILGFVCLSGNAQDYKKINSLKNILKNLPEMNGTDADTTIMKVYIRLGNLYEISEHDSAIYWYTIVADSMIDFENLMHYKGKINLKASAFFMLGRVNYRNNNYSQATKNCMVSLKIYEKLGYKSEISECLRYLGVIESEQGNYIQAISYLDRSLKIDEVVGDKDGIATCLINMGNIIANQGNYAKAISYFEQSLRIFKEINNKNGISGCLTNLGLVTCYQGNYNEANRYYKQSLKIDEDLGDKRGIAICLINLGLVADKQENHNEAISYYEQSMKIVSELDDKRLISICLIGLGNQALGLYNYTLANTYFKQSLEINEKLGDKQGFADCLTNLGLCETYRGNYPEAIAFYKRSVDLKEQLGDKANLATDYAELAKFYIRIHNIPEALNLFLKSQKITLWLLQDNFAIMSESDKSLFLDQMKNIFNFLHEFNLKYSKDRDSLSDICYNNELLLKGLLLNSSAGLVDAIFNSPDAEIKNAFFLLKQIRNQISDLQGTDEPDRDSIIADLEQKANEQERKLARLSKDFANTQNIFTYKWQEVQQNLKSTHAAIELVQINYTFDKHDSVTNDSFSYAALILKPGMQHPEMVPLCDEISLNKIVGNIGWSDPTLVKMIYQKGSRKGLRLYEKIWQPLEPYLKDVKTIYIAPSGVLHQIAFNAIPCPDSSLLCDRYNINMVSSTRILADSAMQEPMFASRNNKVAVFGGIQYDEDTTLIASLSRHHKTNSQQLALRFKESNATRSSVMPWQYLDGSLQEAKTINQLLQQKKIKSVLYSGSNALEEYFKQLEQQPSPDIIHIATHGFSFPLPDKQNAYKIFENSFVQNFNPLFRSGLLFAGANRSWANASRIDSIEDGVLTAYEVSNMNLQNTQLVVLSACETGLGDIKGSEGVYGLQRAFKMAGVKYIIMSLWPVPDNETQELMVTFYDKLIETKNIRKAFVAAQNEMKKKYEPYYWAGFVLIE